MSILHGFGMQKQPELPAGESVSAKQTHSTRIGDCDSPDWQNNSESDGLVASREKIILTIKTADCVPILYADHAFGVIGASHQGWRGTYDRMSVKMIERMEEKGANKGKIRIAIGPSIGPCCYRIYGKRYEIFKQRYARFAERVFVTQMGDTYLNLALLNYLQLIDAGILPVNIDCKPFCTKCDTRFRSFQREGSGYGNMVSYIMRK